MRVSVGPRVVACVCARTNRDLDVARFYEF